MDLQDIATVAAGGGWAVTLWVLRLLFVENRKLRQDERTGAREQAITDQQLRAESGKLLLEATDRARQEIARAMDEPARLMVAMIVAQTSEDWLTAERNAVAFLRRLDRARELHGVQLPSEMEHKR